MRETIPKPVLAVGRDFHVSVGIPPQQRQPGEPVFGIDGAADARSIFQRQNARGGCEFRPGDFSADGAGSNLDLRIIAEPLDLAELAVGHEVELVALLGEPDRRVDGDSGFAEGRERDVTLSVDLGGNGHGHIVINAGSGIVRAGNAEHWSKRRGRSYNDATC